MNKIVLIICIFLISCVTPAKNLKQTNPELYNKIIDKYIYIINSPSFGDSYNTIVFSESGAFSYTFEKFKNTNSWDLTENNTLLVKGKNNYKIVFNNKFNVTIPKIQLLENSEFVTKVKIVDNKTNKFDIYYCAISYNNFKLVKKDLDEHNNISEWNNLNKNSLKEILEYAKNIKSEKINKKVYPVLMQLLDKNIKKYIKKKHRKLYKYMSYTIEYEDGTKSYKFWELFRNLTIRENKIQYRINKKGRKLEFVFGSYDGIRHIYFTISKKSLILRGIRKGYKMNPPQWERACFLIFNNFAIYNFDDYQNKKIKVNFINNNDFSLIL